MLLCFFRHGKAEKTGDKPDFERELTPEGRLDVRLVAKLLPFKPTRIFTSPLKRAVQTASIIAELYGVKYEVFQELKPETARLSSILRLSLADGTVLVGHAPSIEEIISELIGGGHIKLKAGSAAVLEFDENVEAGSGRLVLLITPETARRCKAESTLAE